MDDGAARESTFDRFWRRTAKRRARWEPSEVRTGCWPGSSINAVWP